MIPKNLTLEWLEKNLVDVPFSTIQIFRWLKSKDFKDIDELDSVFVQIYSEGNYRSLDGFLIQTVKFISS